MPQEEYGHSEPEYKFNDEEEATYAQEDEPSLAEPQGDERTQGKATDSFKGRLSGLLSVRQKPPGKLIAVVVVLVIFLVVIYKFSSVMHVSKSKKQQRSSATFSVVNSKSIIPSSPSSPQELPKKPYLVPEETLQPLTGKITPRPGSLPVTQAVSPSSSVAQVAELDSKILKLQETSEQISDAAREQQTEMQMRLLSLEQKIAALNSGLEQLQDSMDEVSTQVKENKALEKAFIGFQKNQKISKDKQVRQLKQFFVQAVIPGRAWLHGADGSTLTVTVGDEVPGYGRVVSIDAYSGAVTMSSGVQIQYGMDG